MSARATTSSGAPASRSGEKSETRKALRTRSSSTTAFRASASGRSVRRRKCSLRTSRKARLPSGSRCRCEQAAQRSASSSTRRNMLLLSTASTGGTGNESAVGAGRLSGFRTLAPPSREWEERCMPLKTALVAAPLLLLIAGLGMAISLRRRREGIGPGMAGDATFIRLQRAHGNAVEHSPILLLALLLLELLGARPSALIAFGVAIIVARAAHAVGIVQRPRHPLHALGAALTYGLEVAMAVSLVLTVMKRSRF
ncbi:MAG: hypothetical protein E6J85_04500 [Deltaproteobacteria bacterium]|nr:MAG: hypothetical protein E6J85_04500 [Deltaproteobacteria bacterium]